MHYRATIRFFAGAQRYAMVDVEAATLPAALQELMARFPAEAAGTADLVEIRRVAEDARAQER